MMIHTPAGIGARCSSLNRTVVRCLGANSRWNAPVGSCSSTTAATSNTRLASDLSPTLVTPGLHPTGFTRNGIYLGSTFLQHSPLPLPQLDVSAILDAKTFCKKYGEHDSAREGVTERQHLVEQGRQHFLQTMQEELRDAPKTGNRHMYIMRDHGVPNQLLDHCLKVAHLWLLEQRAWELVVTDNPLSLLAIRDDTWQSSDWPNPWLKDIELYQTVMTRMARHMSSSLIDRESENNITSDGESADNSSPLEIKDWSISIKRNNVMPPSLLPPQNSDTDVFPVVEWIIPEGPVENRGEMGNVVIRMQNKVSWERKDGGVYEENVAMVFDAGFELGGTKQRNC